MCFKYLCDPNEGLLVKVNDGYVKCGSKNEVVNFTVVTSSHLKTMSVHYGNLICPSCQEICEVNIHLYM